jgi:folylpolyglutamate synthase/dihydropteroate synthase
MILVTLPFSLLGDTIEKIAWQKAGIMKKGCPTFVDPSQPQVTLMADVVALLPLELGLTSSSRSQSHNEFLEYSSYSTPKSANQNCLNLSRDFFSSSDRLILE